MSLTHTLVEKSALLSLRQNTIVSIVAKFLYSLTRWGMLIGIANLGQDTYVGIFGLALAVASPLYLLSNMELSVALATDTKWEFPFQSYLGMRIASSTIAFLASIIISLVFISFDNYEKGAILLVISMMKCTETIGDLMVGLFNREERMLLSAICRTSRGVTSVLALAAGLLIFKSLWVSILLVVVSWIFLLCVLDLRLAESLIDQKISLSAIFIRLPRLILNLKDIFLRTFWLGITRFLNSLTVFFPRYVIDFFFGAALLGGFVAVSYVVIASQMFTTAVLSALAPRLAKEFAANTLDGYYKLLFKIAGILFLVATTMLSGVWFFGEQFLEFAYGQEYRQYSDAFFLLAMVSAVDYAQLLCETATNATRQFKSRLAPAILSVTVVVIASSILIPSFSIEGAAVALMISKVATSIFLVMRLRAICVKRSLSVESILEQPVAAL